MAKQITIRNVSPELSRGLERLSRERGQSLNATVLGLLEQAVGIDARRQRLRRYMTWTEDDGREFDRAMSEMRKPDDGLWK